MSFPYVSLVSIIIPVYNRADLIEETLQSIKEQTYTHFECIIVDDGSTDEIENVVAKFTEGDARFFFFRRPADKPKGANSCRNYGFLKSKGEFIQWFDSDDLMRIDFLYEKVAAIQPGNYDYVISKTKDFKHPHPYESLGINQNYYRFNEFELTHFNYVTQKINWLTPDFLIKRAVVTDIRFNEELFSGQEYNFLCKVTAKTVNAIVVDKTLTLRRLHENSVRSQLLQSKQVYLKNRYNIDFQNWQDLNKISTPPVLNFLFRRSVENSLNTNIYFNPQHLVVLAKAIKKKNGMYTSFLYIVFQVAGRNLKKGHFIRKAFLKRWNKD